ncbi:MAG: S-layer homology domain-containing protein [Ruminococcaceae bacterium]|nr:S-layer homology domain-containing protein [Oscillospiraceae bacterium]
MKKFLSILLSFAILFSCIGILEVSAETEYIEISTAERFKEILESNGDKNIIITRDIIYTCSVRDTDTYWITLGSGKKTLNLNGKNVELNAEVNGNGNNETTMIRVPEGAELIINDSSGDNSGSLWCYGRMEWATDEYSADSPFYYNSDVKYRNVLEIDGGMVTVNGGTLEAGRSKKHWVYNGRDVYDLRHMLEYAIQGGVLALAIGARYDGYAWQQVNGDCITVNDGNLLINDGIFLGRGFSHLETFVKANDNDVDVEFSKATCLRLLGGTTTINGGTFHGKGNADVISSLNEAKVTVKNGTFSTNHLRVLLVPTINTTLYGYYYPYVIGHEQRYGYQYHPASDVGSIKLTSDMLDPQRNTVELNGKILSVSEWSPQTLKNTNTIGSSTIVVTHHMSDADRRKYTSGRDTKTEVSRLNIDGTNAYGMALSPDVLSCDADGVEKISVEWYHNDELAGEDDVMFAGKYQAKVTVQLDRQHAFSQSPNFTIMGDRVSDYKMSATKRTAELWSKVYNLECNHSYNEDASMKFDADKHFISCTACEKNISEEKHIFDAGTQEGDVITYTCNICDYNYQVIDDGKIKIPYLNISIPAPEAGKTPNYNGVINEDGVSFSDGGDEYTENGIRWGKYANDYGIDEDDVFASDMGYRATIYLTIDDAYALHKNNEGEYDTLVYVNGEEARYEVDGNSVTVYYEVNADKVVISSADIMGIDYPEIGKTPDCTPVSVMPHYYDAKADYGSVTWYEDGEYMDKSDTFKGGKTYSVVLYVDTIRTGWDDVATFSKNPTATLNGFSVDEKNVERLTDTTLMITYTFPKLEAEEEKIQEEVKPTEKEKEPEKPTETEKPQESEKATFTDVHENEYYYEPVMWAVSEGITSGTGATTFSPDATCSRGQVVTFLHRMIGSPEPAAISNPFTDVKSDAYYYKPVMWAFGSNITGGTSQAKFSPDANCTRAQVVTFLWRTAGQPKPKENNNPFTDVKPDSYYYDAVLWAVEQGITGGTSQAKFSPDAKCTRGQVVTFLYRFINGN